MTDPTDYARGDYQIALLTGQARWSGSDLAGAARKWSGRYRTSRINLLDRLQCAGFAAEIRDYRNDNARTMRVLYVDGVAVSATS